VYKNKETTTTFSFDISTGVGRPLLVSVGVGEWCRNVFIKDTIETYLAERRKCPEEFKRGEDKEKKKKIVPFIDSLVIRFKKEERWWVRILSRRG
jgi:hypothetical protein